jgi:hypothetical protein
LKRALPALLLCWLALPVLADADHPVLELARELALTRKPDMRVTPGAPALRQAEHALEQRICTWMSARRGSVRVIFRAP